MPVRLPHTFANSSKSGIGEWGGGYRRLTPKKKASKLFTVRATVQEGLRTKFVIPDEVRLSTEVDGIPIRSQTTYHR